MPLIILFVMLIVSENIFVIILNIDNLRTLKIELLENKGKYNFDNIVYADLYKIRISYMCLDNANTCVTKIEDGKGGNLSFTL